MIRTIEELVLLTVREAASKPYLADELLLQTPGCSAEEIAEIRAGLPGIPESYLGVAAQVALPNVSVGYLNLAPGTRESGRLVDRLRQANSSAWPLWQSVDDHHLYHVADYEGDMICVVREGQPDAGEIVRMDLSCPPTPDLHRVAWSFEHLLLGFGRLRELFLEEQFGQEAIRNALISLVHDFHLDSVQLEDWTWFAEVAVGE